MAVAAIAVADPFSVVGTGGAIPDNDAGGVVGSGNFAGTPGSITSLDRVTIFEINHSWVGDLTAILSHGGTDFYLFHRPGTGTFGHSDDLAGTYDFIPGASLTIDQAAAAATGVVPAGAYLPAWQGSASSIPGTNGTLSNFNAYNGQDPNGTWTLTIIDLAGGDTGSFQGFAVAGTYTPVPEPATMMALGLGAAALLRRRKKA